MACPEEIAFRSGYIDGEQMQRLASAMKNQYGRYLEQVVQEKVF